MSKFPFFCQTSQLFAREAKWEDDKKCEIFLSRFNLTLPCLTQQLKILPNMNNKLDSQSPRIDVYKFFF